MKFYMGILTFVYTYINIKLFEEVIKRLNEIIYKIKLVMIHHSRQNNRDGTSTL